MKIVVAAGRLLLGLFVFTSGALFFLDLEHFPPLKSAVAQALFVSFQESGLLTVAKAFEVAFGLSMFTNRFVPLALVMFYPITVIIAYFDILLLGGENFGYYTGGAMLVIHTGLLFAYLPYYGRIFAGRATPALSLSS